MIFPDLIKQYASLNRNEIYTLLNNLNISKDIFNNYEDVKNLLGTIENKRAIIKDVYTKYKNQHITSNQYSTQKDRMITLSNGESQTTRAYTLKLTSEQTSKIYSNIVKELNYKPLSNITIQEFPEVTFTIYVFEKKTSRIVIEYGNKNVRIDFYNNELNIQYTNVIEDKMETTTVEIKNENGQTVIDIINQDQNNQQNNYKLKFGTEKNENNTKLNTIFSVQNSNIKALEIDVQQNIELSDEIIIDKKLSEQLNVNLTTLENYRLVSAVSSLLKIIDSRLNSVNREANSEIITKWLAKNGEIENNCEELSEKIKNDFNNQLLPYKGEDISKEIIYNMLDVVGRNMSDYAVYSGDNIKIFLEQGTQNSGKAEELKNLIKKVNSSYNINFQYNSDGKISVILMEKYIKRR